MFKKIVLTVVAVLGMAFGAVAMEHDDSFGWIPPPTGPSGPTYPVPDCPRHGCTEVPKPSVVE